MTAQMRFTDEDLHGYLDNEIDAEKRAAVEAWLAEDREAAERLRSFRRLNERFRLTFDELLDDPTTRQMQRKVMSHQTRLPRPRWQMLAASLVISVVSGAAGYGLHGYLESERPPASLADKAIGAHTVFVSEVRHPVEVQASEEAHLIAWLTKRVGHKLKAPVLTTSGFNLIGGRLLADEGQPAAQFMYEDAKGRRLTLYVRLDTKDADTSFAFTSINNVSAFTWIDAPLAYGLIGQLPREELQEIARVTYNQLATVAGR